MLSEQVWGRVSPFQTPLMHFEAGMAWLGLMARFDLPMAYFQSKSGCVFGRFLIHLYVVVHSKFHVRGAGFFIRWVARFVPAFRSVSYQVPGAGHVLLDLRDQSAFGLINFSLGEYGHDQRLLDYIGRCLQPGAVLWDVGANAGCFSLYFSRSQFGLASIHAFEPNPVALTPLESLFHEHRVVRVHAVALGRCDERRVMQVVPRASVHSSFVRQLDGAESVPIEIRSGDGFLSVGKAAPPDVIKIDVEGFEVEVITGLRATIASKRPVIVFEHGWLSDDQLQEILQAIPSDYLLLFVLGETLTSDISARRDGDDAILLPAEKGDLLKNPGKS